MAPLTFYSLDELVNVLTMDILGHDLGRSNLNGKLFTVRIGKESPQDMGIACFGIELVVLELTQELDG